MQDVGVSIGVGFDHQSAMRAAIVSRYAARSDQMSLRSVKYPELANTLNWSADKVKSRFAQGAQAGPARIAKANRPGRP